MLSTLDYFDRVFAGLHWSSGHEIAQDPCGFPSHQLLEFSKALSKLLDYGNRQKSYSQYKQNSGLDFS